MYSSLRKIDIVAAKDGTKLLVQTDHREKAEVEAELELSVLFALTRAITPKRSAEHADGVVRYVAMGELHPALARVLASTGATAESQGAPVDLSGVPRAAPADLADDAFAALGKRALAKGGWKPDVDGLAAFEKVIAMTQPDEEEDEIAFWTAVVELAAVTGEVMRATVGGRWVDDPADYSDIPFMFQVSGDEAFMNPVGKAIKFFLHGEAESPRQLLRALEDRGTPEGPLLPSLKPSHWGARDQAVCEPAMPDLTKSGADVPLVVYGHDHPNTFALLMKDGAREKDMARLRTEALANLAKVDVEVERVDLEALTFWAVTGSYFACEKLLDVTFMKTLHQMLGSPLLAACIPEKGRLFVTTAVAGPEKIGPFMAIAQGAFERNEGNRQISPTVFLVSEGRVVGVASRGSSEPDPEPEPENKKKKGFFARLFN